MRVEYHEFSSRVWQQRNEPINDLIQPHLPEDARISIIFKRYDVSVVNNVQRPLFLAAQETATDVLFSNLLTSSNLRAVAADFFSDVLSLIMEIPEPEQHGIVNGIFTVVESAKTTMPIFVDIIRRTVERVEITNLNEDEIERVVRESMDAYEVKAIPAAKSTIEGLERVKVDVEESCVICMESFEDGVRGVRLPCSHIFHEKCCVQWLMTSQLCPLCRYRVPSEQDLLAN